MSRVSGFPVNYCTINHFPECQPFQRMSSCTEHLPAHSLPARSTSWSFVLNGVWVMLCLGEGQGERDGVEQGEDVGLAEVSSAEWWAARLARRQRGLHHSFWVERRMSILALCSLRADWKSERVTMQERVNGRSLKEVLNEFPDMHLTQGHCIGTLGGNREGHNEVRAWWVRVDKGGTVSSELQNAANNLHHLRGITHGPEKHKGKVLKIQKKKITLIKLFSVFLDFFIILSVKSAVLLCSVESAGFILGFLDSWIHIRGILKNSQSALKGDNNACSFNCKTLDI